MPVAGAFIPSLSTAHRSPPLRLQIDGRECLQRLVNAFLYHVDWDNDHLFEAVMPRRGPLADGAVLLGDLLGSSLLLDIKDQGDPDSWDPPLRRRVERRLQETGCTMADVRARQANAGALSGKRKLRGAAMDPFADAESGGPECTPGGAWSLEQLCLAAGDKIKLTYDLGDMHEFSMEVEEVCPDAPAIPEVDLGYENATRARLLDRGPARMARQYRGESDSESE